MGPLVVTRKLTSTPLTLPMPDRSQPSGPSVSPLATTPAKEKLVTSPQTVGVDGGDGGGDAGGVGGVAGTASNVRHSAIVMGVTERTSWGLPVPPGGISAPAPDPEE